MYGDIFSILCENVITNAIIVVDRNHPIFALLGAWHNSRKMPVVDDGNKTLTKKNTFSKVAVCSVLFFEPRMLPLCTKHFYSSRNIITL